MNEMADRHQIRANWHDYNGGIYFVTICCYEKKHLFGVIRHNEMQHSELGKIAMTCVEELPSHHPGVEILNYVIMPNHIHLMVAIQPQSVGTRYIASADGLQTYVSSSEHNIGCLKPPKHGSICNDFHHNSRLSVVIGSLKAAVTRRARHTLTDIIEGQVGGDKRVGRDVSRPYWQPRFHEHIVRNQRAFNNIMAYISSNVEYWSSDCFYD